MDDECVRQLALNVAKQAIAEMASPAASSEEKLKAYSFVLGSKWAKRLIKEASAHAMGGLVRSGLANSATNQMARKQGQARGRACARQGARRAARWMRIHPVGGPS